jgi:hypothetical protein
MAERVVEQRPQGVASVALRPVRATEGDAHVTCALVVIDLVDPALADDLVVDHDREPRIVVVLGGLLVRGDHLVQRDRTRRAIVRTGHHLEVRLEQLVQPRNVLAPHGAECHDLTFEHRGIVSSASGARTAPWRIRTASSPSTGERTR